NAARAEMESPFELDFLADRLKAVLLPEKSMSAKQGTRSASGCTLLVADQGSEAVLGAKPNSWDPKGCSFADLAKRIKEGSRLYLTTRSGKGAVQRKGAALQFESALDDAGQDVVVRALVPRVPFPQLLPQGVGCQVAFWIGAAGNNFGLHSDLFSEQFLCQHQGTKEVLLLLPDDAADVDPFPFLSSPLWYKSQSRSVSRLRHRNDGLRAILQPGDVLYIPLWWWHEVCTITEGASVSTTFRFHSEDADRFAKVMNAFYQFHANAKAYGSGRLAKHLRSYFVNAIVAEEEPRGTGWSRSALLGGALLAALFAVRWHWR
ncbi:lcm-2, partial [Symbiodinium sp. CCMP2456]